MPTARTARSAPAALLASAALLLAGCGGSEGSGDGSGAGSSTEPSRTITVPAPSPGGSGEGLRPDPSVAHEDKPDAYDQGCQARPGSSEVITCTFGAEDPGDAGTSVALVGDSKAMQWLPALEAIAEEEGWRVVTMTKSGCQWTDAISTVDGAPDAECHAWGAQVTDDLLELSPDLVVTSGVRNRAATVENPGQRSVGALADGYAQVWDEVTAAGSPVAVLTDTPQPGDLEDVPTCVATHPGDAEACTIPFNEGSGTEPLRAGVERSEQARLIDLTGVLCPEQTCRPTFGDVLIYREGSHVTATYAAELAPTLRPALTEALTASF